MGRGTNKAISELPSNLHSVWIGLHFQPCDVLAPTEQECSQAGVTIVLLLHTEWLIVIFFKRQSSFRHFCI